MEDIREIVTKAVLAKGKKELNVKKEIPLENLQVDNIDVNTITQVLGILVINQNYRGKLNGCRVDVVGSSSLNIWASFNNQTVTDVIKEIVNIQTQVNIRNVTENTLPVNVDVVVRNNTEPRAKEVKLENNILMIDLVYEVIVEVIGEAKVKVVVCNNNNSLDDTFLDEINENFIDEKCQDMKQ